MLTIVSGVPGSGKSYYAVDKIHSLSDRTKILQNVDGLDLGTKIDTYCSENSLRPLDLFTNEFHKNNKIFHGFLIVLDECQSFFPRRFSNQDVELFFQLHRHYGIDIILLTQDIKLVAQSISIISELQLRAVSDTANPLPGSFLYRKMVNNEPIGRIYLRKKKSVFELYKSASYDPKKARKKSKPMTIIFFVIAVLCIAGLYGIWKVSRNLANRETPSKVSAIEQAIEKATQPKRDQEKRNQIKEEQNYDPGSTYPPSMVDHFGGVPMAVSILQEREKRYIVLNGILFPAIAFPYEILKTVTGYIAVVPHDVWAYNQYMEQEYENIRAQSEAETKTYSDTDSFESY